MCFFRKFFPKFPKQLNPAKPSSPAPVPPSDKCMADLSNNEVAIKDAQTLIADTEDEVADLDNTVAAKTEKIEQLATEIANTQKAIAKATEERKEENAAFTAEVENQQLTIGVLNKAMAKLEKFYLCFHRSF